MSSRILFTILHDLLIFATSFFLALWIRLDMGNAIILYKEIWYFQIIFSFTNILLLKYMGLYHGIWRYASLHEIKSIIQSVLVSTLVLIGMFFIIFRLENIPRSFPILLFIISIFGVTGPRVIYRIFKDNLKKNKLSKIPVLVFGDSSSAENFIRFTKQNNESAYEVIGLIGLKENTIGRRIHNIPIIASIQRLESIEGFLKKNLGNKLPQRIIISDPKIKPQFLESLYIFSQQNGLAIGMLPKISNLSDKDKKNKFEANPIVIEDVLGRKQKVNNPRMLKNISGKTILVTGAGGSIGSELSKQIYRLKPKLLILLEQNEYSLFKISSVLPNNTLASLTDVRDTKKIEHILSYYKPDYVFHTAALKHITFVEDDPIEALKTNFLATVKLCQLCKMLKLKKMIFISTDKAVNPSNVMGASKRLCEKYIQSISKDSKETVFTIVRFGNVLGSTGSVVPLFEKQISQGGPITITHPEVKRYFMTIREAVELVLISSQLKIKENGELYILEMGDSILIKDLAKRMILLSGKSDNEIKIKFTGLRKGEKLDEQLFFNDEKISKTIIEGILSTNSKLFNVEVEDFNKLISEIQKNDKKNLMHTFDNLLPEYSRDDNL